MDLLLAGTTVAGAEATQGRTLFGRLNQFKFWSNDTSGPDNSQSLIDPYSFTHIEHGLYFYAILVGLIGLDYRTAWITALVLESGWEVLENSNWGIDKYRASSFVYGGDSIVNSIGDLVFMALGFMIGDNIGSMYAVVLAFALDMFLWYKIGDSLLNNITQLLLPHSTKSAIHYE